MVRIINLIFFFFCSLGYSQMSKIDSLLNVLNAPKNDTVRMKTYQEVISFYSVNDLVKANQYSDSLLVLVRKMNYGKGEINYYVLKGILEYRKSDFKSAIRLWKKGLNHPEIHKYYRPRVSMASNIAVGYKALKENDSFVKYSEMGLALNIEENNIEGLLANYFTLADHYSANLDFQLSANYTNKLMELAISENDHASLARAHVMFGKLNRLEFQYDEAVTEFQKAVKIYENEFPDNKVVQRSLKYEVARSLIKKKDYKKASEILEEILLQEKNNNISQSFQSQVKMYLLKCYSRMGDKIRSNLYYNDLQNGLILSTPQDSIMFYFVKSEFELEFNKHDATTYGSLYGGLEISRNHSELEGQSNLHKLLSTYYAKTGDFSQAYFNLKEGARYSDSLRTTKNAIINLYHQRKFEAIKSQNTILEQENEISRQDEEIQRQRVKKQQLFSLFLGTLALLGFTLAVYFVLRTRHLRRENEFQLAVADKRKLEQELIKKDIQHSALTELANESDFDEFLLKRFKLEIEELRLWKLISDGLSQKEQADELYKSVDTIKTWKRIKLYPKLDKVVPVSGNYNQHTSTKLYKDEIKRFYNMRYQNKLTSD